MNLELIMAVIVLWIGIKGTLKVLKTGSPDNAVKLKKQELEDFIKSSKNTAAYIIAWLLCLMLGIFMIYVSVSYILTRIN